MAGHGICKQEGVLDWNRSVVGSVEQEDGRGRVGNAVLSRQLKLKLSGGIGSDKVCSGSLVRVLWIQGDDRIREDSKVEICGGVRNSRRCQVTTS